MSLIILLVEKTGTLKTLQMKEYNESELYKKCGFKKPDGFAKQTEWIVKHDSKKYVVSMYAKTEGKANCENKYDFPPPIDSILFFGTCAIVCEVQDGETKKWENLTVELWEKLYEQLFGGFEDLITTEDADNEDEDELMDIPDEKKTKDGYLKDGFVVDGSESSEHGSEEEESYDEDDDMEIDEEKEENDLEDFQVEDIGSELSEETYNYEDPEEEEDAEEEEKK